MSTNEKRMLDREVVRSIIQQWNANRLDLFALSEPDENLLFHGVMRFYFQDAGQKVATKCIRVASDATVSDVIETLIEKFRPDMRMLSLPNYALYEVYSNGEEKKLNPDEKPLLVQLNWHIDDREGRFLLRNVDQRSNTLESSDTNFKRKLSKREKKEQKKKEKLAKHSSDGGTGTGGNGMHDENHVAEKLYTELPETSFTRSISNPEAVMRRRRQQKLEKKLQQFRSKDGGPDTGGTLKIYGESLCRDVPYKTLLLSIRDCAQAVVREMLSKYGLDKADPLHYCLVQVNSDGTEYILDDDECPLSILMNHPTSRGSIMFHVRRRPADSQPRRRKKKPLGASNGTNNMSSDREGPMLVEVTHSGDGGRRIKLGSDPIEVGSANTNTLQLFGPSIQARHCLISLSEGVCTVTPLHADALTFVNGHHIQQPTILHNGSVVMFGRVASYRFLDSPSDGRYNLALSQSQLDSACLYESRSPTSPGEWNDEENNVSPSTSSSAAAAQAQIKSTKSLNYFDTNSDSTTKLNKISCGNDELDNKSHSQDGDQNYDLDVNTETKSISSVRSSGSVQDVRNPKIVTNGGEIQAGQEPILPAVLEFPETQQDSFLRKVITDLDVNAPNFKLAPVYSLYLCARYRASTHYRPDLQPTERAHKLTVFLHHVANLIYSTVQDQYTDPRILAFWMANSSEFLHFLKSDRHISAFSVQAQEVLAEGVQTAFRNLVNCFRVELSQTLNQFLSENIDHDSAAGLVLTVLGSAMALLRRCRVNAALTIQLFSQLFHYINVTCFNTIVANSHMCTAEWGKVVSERLSLLELWAERQGLELAADCHLAKINQCAQFLQAPKSTVEEIQQLACSCFRLNSLQMAALLQQEQIPRNLVDTAIRMAESVADELTRADGREVRLEESPELHLALLLPDDGFSCDVVRGIPSGLVDFLNPLQAAGMCRLAAQPTSVGLWTVYMHQFNLRSPSAMSSKLPQPEMHIIKLHKNSNGMGLSIVAAKGAGQERLGIYIKSVVPGGAADADGRLQAGDQLLRVDGQSLIGITQERAADYLVRTGPIVTLEVAKQGAIYHGLATLLQQPSPVIQRGNRRMSERDISRIGTDSRPSLSSTSVQPLPNSKSVPALHYVGNLGMSNNKSRSIHSLVSNGNEQSFYQNLSVYRAQNPTSLLERPPLSSSHSTSTIISTSAPQHPGAVAVANTTTTMPMNQPHSQQHQQTISSRPQSAYFSNNPSSNSTVTMPSPNSMSYLHLSSQQPNLNGNISNHPHTLHQQIQAANASGGAGTQMGARSKSTNFIRENQSQHSLRMNQMMAPSMPNIAHSSGYASNISASQSMQNVNMIASNNPVGGYVVNQQTAFNPSVSYGQEQQLLPPGPQRINGPSAGPMRGQAKLAELGELVNRRNRGPEPIPHIIDPHTGNQMISPLSSQHSGMHINSATMPRPGIGLQAMSPIKQLPPTAPKPTANRPPQPPPNFQQHSLDDSQPPLPPTTTHPLFKSPPGSSVGSMNYVTSTLDPPKVAYYPVTQPSATVTRHPTLNPWEREEREKEHEIRREHIRLWRDQHISELSALSIRTHQQDEQLKTLVLERDFERRAQETEDPEDENETVYNKEDAVENIRPSGPQNNTIQLAASNIKQSDSKLTAQSQIDAQQQSDSLSLTTEESAQPSYQGYPIQQSQVVPTTSVQPKGILKHNNNRYDTTINTNAPSSPSKGQKTASFAADHRLHTDHQITQLTKEMGNVGLNSEPSLLDSDNNPPEILRTQKESPDQHSNNVAAPPPPPPERNSSYLIMSQQQLKSRNPPTSSKPTFSSPLIVTEQQQSMPSSNIVGGQLSKRLSQMNNINNNNNKISIPPTTASMLLQQQQGQYQQSAPLSPSVLNSMQHHIHNLRTNSSSTTANNDNNKRVSFHDEENNFVISSLTEYGEQADLEMIREDPNRFIQETTAILQAPTTPEADVWNTSTHQTPGVIGAQEVYRDPRTRRLAEKQQQQQNKTNEAVPEKLSFKEKMKMFALESGEDQTPKDKLKISRAQRDIDAVH